MCSQLEEKWRVIFRKLNLTLEYWEDNWGCASWRFGILRFGINFGRILKNWRLAHHAKILAHSP